MQSFPFKRIHVLRQKMQSQRKQILTSLDAELSFSEFECKISIEKFLSYVCNIYACKLYDKLEQNIRK